MMWPASSSCAAERKFSTRPCCCGVHQEQAAEVCAPEPIATTALQCYSLSRPGAAMAICVQDIFICQATQWTCRSRCRAPFLQLMS